MIRPQFWRGPNGTPNRGYSFEPTFCEVLFHALARRFALHFVHKAPRLPTSASLEVAHPVSLHATPCGSVHLDEARALALRGAENADGVEERPRTSLDPDDHAIVGARERERVTAVDTGSLRMLRDRPSRTDEPNRANEMVGPAKNAGCGRVAGTADIERSLRWFTKERPFDVPPVGVRVVMAYRLDTRDGSIVRLDGAAKPGQ